MSVVAEQYANLNTSLGNAQTTINQGGGIAAGDTSVTVTGHTGFPTLAQYRILIDNEIIVVTGGAGTNTWTIQRGVEGTTAASHANGATVTHVLTAAGLIGVAGSINLSGTDASLPAAGVTGRQYLPNDNNVLYREDGNAWSAFGPIWPLKPVVSGNYSWVNQGAATLSGTNGAETLYAPATAGAELRLRVKSAPSTPYNIVMGFLPGLPGDTSVFPGMGFVFRESSTGKLVTWSYATQGFGPGIQAQKWTNETTFGAGYASSNQNITTWRFFPFIWQKVRDDGTNLTFWYGPDGKNWWQQFQVSRTDFMTGGPNQVGFWVNCNQATYDCWITVYDWEES